MIYDILATVFTITGFWQVVIGNIIPGSILILWGTVLRMDGQLQELREKIK